MTATATKPRLVQHSPDNRALKDAGLAFSLEDGSFVIPAEKVKQFGGGDLAKGRSQLRLLLAAEDEREIAAAGPVRWPPSVTMATPADEPAILELLLADVRENAERIAPADPATIMAHIQAGTRGRGGLTVVVRDAQRKPVAVSIIIPMTWWWSRSFYYQDMVTYVSPEHRKSRHVHDLIEAQKWFVEKMSADSGTRMYLLCGVLGFHRVRAKAMMYSRKMRQVGWAYLWPCPWGNDTRS